MWRFSPSPSSARSSRCRPFLAFTRRDGEPVSGSHRNANVEWAGSYAGFCPACAVTVISLGALLPIPSSGLPEDSAGSVNIFCLALLRTRFTWPPVLPRTPVVSYTTLSPLPGSRSPAVYSLLHFLAGYPGWALPTILPCGARTFLGAVSRDATASPTHSGVQSTAEPSRLTADRLPRHE